MTAQLEYDYLNIEDFKLLSNTSCIKGSMNVGDAFTAPEAGFFIYVPYCQNKDSEIIENIYEHGFWCEKCGSYHKYNEPCPSRML